MAGAISNVDEVAALLERLVAGFDFTTPGIGKAIGQEALDVVAEGIADRTIVGQRDAGGGNLAELTPKYRAAKLRKGYPDLIGVRTGKMLSLEQLKGRRVVEATVATMEYGSDGSADYARYFGEKRPFYGWDEDIRRAVESYMQRALALYVSRSG